MSAARASHLFLSGYMGTGKSTVGPVLAARLGRPFIDLDAAIVGAAGCSISELFEREGEAGFRTREAATLRSALGEAPAVVALGGGAVTQAPLRRWIRRQGWLVTLVAAPGTLRARLAEDPDRPLAAGADPLARLAARADAYADCDLQVDTAGRTPDQVAAVILTAYAA